MSVGRQPMCWDSNSGCPAHLNCVFSPVVTNERGNRFRWPEQISPVKDAMSSRNEDIWLNEPASPVSIVTISKTTFELQDAYICLFVLFV
jgi:hypothetical protein